jgi:hypothetical protein
MELGRRNAELEHKIIIAHVNTAAVNRVQWHELLEMIN